MICLKSDGPDKGRKGEQCSTITSVSLAAWATTRGHRSTRGEGVYRRVRL
jgi:hypothetical protein